jgi:hypothetical protein
MATWERDPSDPNAEERPNRSIVAIFTKSACILIGATFSPVAIKINCGQSFKTITMTTISGRSTHRTYRYRHSESSNELEVMRSSSSTWYKFRQISHAVALNKMTLFAASKKGKETGLPTTKHIVIRQTVREAPKLIAAVRLSEQSWAMETCRLQINFQKRSLTLQFPFRDWLSNLEQ